MTTVAVPAEFEGDFRELMEDQRVGAMPITRFQAWCLMSSVQLASRHPDVAAAGGIVMATAVDVARELQRQLSTTPALAAVAELGWRPEADLPAVEGTKCRACGCTEENGCPEGCFWVEPNLCSRCAARVAELVLP